jgi:hypothetical protein
MDQCHNHSLQLVRRRQKIKTNALLALTGLLGLLGVSVASAADQHPIIEIETGYFFGASEKRKWIKADQAAKSVTGETDYRVYSLTNELGQVKGSQPKSVDEPCPDTLVVSLSATPKGGIIGLAAPWNALPRKPVIADTTQPVYVEAVRDFLKGRGIKEPKVRITRILGVDLEGDGEDEVLINATNYFTKDDDVPMDGPRGGSYSIVLLRRLVAGKVRTQLVAGEIYAKPDASIAPNLYTIPAVLDLNGDGKFEVIVHSIYYEGGETTIYEFESDSIKPVLSVACGA